jgi:phosphatidylglycerol---prolipoprotein diacylglyceryl transferase
MHPVLFNIGPLAVYSYGFFVAIALAIGVFLIQKNYQGDFAEKDALLDCIIWVVLGGLVGGRFLYVIINAEYFMLHPLKILAVRDGGMAIQGSIAGAFISGTVVCIAKKIPVMQMADIIAPYAALGQAIGRIGCFFNGCCYGRIYCGIMNVTFPGDPMPRIPVQLISSLGLLIIYIVLRFVERYKLKRGSIIFLYLIFYGAFRFFVDYLRADNSIVTYGLTWGQIISLVLALIGTLGFTMNRRMTTG